MSLHAPISALPLFAQPDIRVPAPSAPGSITSADAADAIGPWRRRSWRRILRVLAELPQGATMSREAICSRLGIKESSGCGRISELSPTWIEKVEGACVAVSGLRVNGYRLTDSGRRCVP